MSALVWYHVNRVSLRFLAVAIHEPGVLTGNTPPNHFIELFLTGASPEPTYCGGGYLSSSSSSSGGGGGGGGSVVVPVDVVQVDIVPGVGGSGRDDTEGVGSGDATRGISGRGGGGANGGGVELLEV
jgi:hypothetical protein